MGPGDAGLVGAGAENGLAERADDERRGGRARVLVTAAPRSEVAGPPLPRLHGDGRPHARAQPSFTLILVAAPRAASSTWSRSIPVLAWMAPMTVPSTSGASQIRTRGRRSGSISSSMASWAESTAEPRSTSTSTPSPSSTASIASAIRVASVPMPPSSVPPAARSRTPSAIWAASSTVPWATLAEWDTTTRPTLMWLPPLRARGCGWPWPPPRRAAARRRPHGRRPAGSGAPAEGWGVDGCVPQAGGLLVQAQDGDRGALHLQAGDVGADQGAGDLHAALDQQTVDVAVDHVQLRQGGAAHGVDKHQRPLALGQAQVVDDRAGQPLGELVGGLHRDALPAGFAVDADADLDLGVAQLEGGLARRGHGAAGQGQAHGADVGGHLAGQVGHLGQGGALLGLGAGQLLEQDGAAHAAAALGVQGVLDGDVVVDDHAGHGGAG